MSMEAQRYRYREEYKNIRNRLSRSRRQEASEKLFNNIAPLVRPSTLVLSYHSFFSELSTIKINHFLADKGLLILPKIVQSELKLFKIVDLKRDLLLGNHGIYEPNPICCKEVMLEKITLALVPGIVFDTRGFRLGWGGGFYDRLLTQKHKVQTKGVGFKEQLYPGKLPVKEHDIELKANIFF